MGAADVVPGVSGGTIAFISGIYEELVTTIDRLDFGFFKLWKKEGLKNAFAYYNIGFLLTLFAGVFVSILSLAKLVTFLLDEYPILLWSFFFGLVVASIGYIAKQIKEWSVINTFAMLIGAALVYFVTVAAPAQAPDVWYMYFLSGCIAIIAMILPGLSGSLILVLLGSYAIVIGAITGFFDALFAQEWSIALGHFKLLFLFGLGCIIGLKLFSKALKYMFEHKEQLTLAILTGFMIGSLNRIWPWKEVLSTRVDRHGDTVPLEVKSILPSAYNGDPKIMFAILLAVIGFLLIWILERSAKNKPV